MPPRRPLHPATPPWLARAIVFALAAYWVSRGLVTAAKAVESLLVVVVLSFVIAAAYEIPVTWLSRFMRRGLATALVLGTSLVALLGLIIGVGVLATRQVSSLFTHLPATIRHAVRLINAHLHTHLSATSISNKIKHLDLVHTRLTHVALSSLTQVASLLAGLLFTFYFTAEGPQMRDRLVRLVSPERQGEMHRVLDLAVEKSGSYFLARFLLSTVRFCVALPVLLACHTPEPFALAIWYALLAEFIPVIGTTLATALPAVVAASVSLSSALVVLGVLLVFTVIRNYAIAPKLTRHTVKLHPALAFAGVVVAVILFGPIAGLLAVPVLATITAFSSSYLHRHELAEPDPLLSRTDTP